MLTTGLDVLPTFKEASSQRRAGAKIARQDFMSGVSHHFSGREEIELERQ
jgi:hypothetical protein